MAGEKGGGGRTKEANGFSSFDSCAEGGTN